MYLRSACADVHQSVCTSLRRRLAPCVLCPPQPEVPKRDAEARSLRVALSVPPIACDVDPPDIIGVPVRAPDVRRRCWVVLWARALRAFSRYCCWCCCHRRCYCCCCWRWLKADRSPSQNDRWQVHYHRTLRSQLCAISSIYWTPRAVRKNGVIRQAALKTARCHLIGREPTLVFEIARARHNDDVMTSRHDVAPLDAFFVSGLLSHQH